MADNTTANIGTGGDVFAAKDIGGIKYPRNILTTPAGVDVIPLAEGGTVVASGTVTANLGTVAGLALDATLTGGTQKTRLVDASGNQVGATATAGVYAINTQLSGMTFTISTVNSSTAQLAAAATFSGTIEAAFNQPAAQLMVICDQNYTVNFDQYDGANNLVSTDTFTRLAGVALNENVQVNGDSCRIRVTNNGGSTTTTLRIETTYGPLPPLPRALTNLGNLKTSLSEVNGTATATGNGVAGTGVMRVAIASDNTAVPTGVVDVSGSGSLTALNQAVTLSSLSGKTTGLIQLSGTWVGSIQLEGSNDSFTTTTTLSTTQSGGAAPSTTAITAAGDYRVLGIVNYASVRARCSAYTSGTIVVNLKVSDANGIQPVISTNALGFLTSSQITDGTNTATVKAASTAAVTADKALVVGLHPTSPLPVGTNVIGALTANQSVNVAQINAVTPLMGNGVTGTGSQRGTIASDNSAVALWGHGATGAAVPANAQLHGLRAATANPTNATGGNSVAAMGDKAGKIVTTAVAPRELMAVQQTALAATAETTFITAGAAGVFNDITQLIVTTAGLAAATLTIKDATAGTTRMILNYPNAAVAPGSPLVINFNPPIPQAAAAANWTVTNSVATATNITAIYAKNL